MGLPMFGQTMGKFSLNQIPTLSHKFNIANSFIILIRPSFRRQSLSHRSLEVYFICWGHYESILFIVSIFIFFLLCFLWFYGNAPLKYYFEFLYQENTYFPLYYFFVKKSIFNFDKSNLLSINIFPIALLVINHIEILSQNNHLFKVACRVQIWKKTFYGAKFGYRLKRQTWYLRKEHCLSLFKIDTLNFTMDILTVLTWS